MIEFRPIGIIHSPFKERLGTPRQSVGAYDVQGTISIAPEFIEGLVDLKDFSHILIVFYMHLIQEAPLLAHPPWDEKPHGVFATCSPHRPNPIGVSVVKLLSISGTHLTVGGIDMVDGTPVLDIKPYVPSLFPREQIKIGWLSGKEELQNSSKAGEGAK